MKAKDYYAKYSESLKNPNTSCDTAYQLYMDFLKEMTEIINTRHIKFNAYPVVKEQNDKWNALCRMFDPPIIQIDAFRDITMEQLKKSQEEKGK